MEGEVCLQKHNVAFIAPVMKNPPSEQISIQIGSCPCPFSVLYDVTVSVTGKVDVLRGRSGAKRRAHRVTTCSAPQLHLLSSWRLGISGGGASQKLVNTTDLVFSLLDSHC